MMNLTAKMREYMRYLRDEEKSENTILKYRRDINRFIEFAQSAEESADTGVTKQTVIAYKEMLCGAYSVSSINSMLVAVNGFLKFADRGDCCVKLLRTQRHTYICEERQLTRYEYQRLITAAQNRQDIRLSLVMETICATGIRVSELRFITAEAVISGVAKISMKGKCRSVFLPGKLRKKLKEYMKKERIRVGVVFCTCSGKPLDRSNIWTQMKKLCVAAGVEATKVFPHNLRHLFARIFYQTERDIVALADILGHSSVETTRIYTKITAGEQAQKIERLQLIT